MAFTTAVNTSLLTTYLIRKFIPALEAELQFSKFTTKAVIPPGQGKIGRFNVFNNPPGTTTGTDCTIAEYGEYIKVSDLQEMTQVKTARDELVSRMAYGGALCIDRLVRTQAATTTVNRSCSATSPWTATGGTKPTAMNLASLIAARTNYLKNVSNTAVRGFTGVANHRDGNHAAIMSPRAELDLVTEGTTGRITWQNAVVNTPGSQGQGRFVKGYMGECYGVSCYSTQEYDSVTITSLSDANYVLGEGGIGAVGFNDMDAKVIVNEINSPYKNSNSVAWHAYFGTSLIDANRVVKLYSLNA